MPKHRAIMDFLDGLPDASRLTEADDAFMGPVAAAAEWLTTLLDEWADVVGFGINRRWRAARPTPLSELT
jgi:hypothetical protein